MVENRTGAGMITGTSAVARAAPDGYTLLVATSSPLAINPAVHKKLPYDPVEDFVPVALIANSPFTLVVHLSLPVNVGVRPAQLAKDKPGQLSYGSAGPGSPHHLFFELLKAMTGLTPPTFRIAAMCRRSPTSSPAISRRCSPILRALPIIRDGKVRLH